MNITTINNPSGLISVFGRPDMKELVAASAQTRFEPNDQLGQVFAKVHTVPEETETDPQFGGRRSGLGPEARSRAGDWMGLGLGSTGQRPGLRLESQAKGQDWPGLNTEVTGRVAKYMQKLS